VLRILLDAHVSVRVIATALRSDGHDVRALAEERSLDGLDDPQVLELAAHESRILITHDIKDFAPLLRTWAEAGRTHGGCVMVHGIGHHEFGRVLRGLRRLFAQRPGQNDWIDLPIFLSPAADGAFRRRRG
jgi:hypothetical protein